MAVSTEVTLRNALLAQLRAASVAQTILGFQEPEGNIRGYLLENEASERTADYLSAVVAGENIVQAIGIHVVGNDVPYAAKMTSIRVYDIRFRYYREIGVEGAGEHWILDAARATRNVLRLMGVDLNGLVSQINSGSKVSISKQNIQVENDTGEILIGAMDYEATRTNPDF